MNTTSGKLFCIHEVSYIRNKEPFLLAYKFRFYEDEFRVVRHGYFDTGHLVHTLADKGERVLDPACGSGTTLQQAFKKQREAVGIEVDEAYCEKAAKKRRKQIF